MKICKKVTIITLIFTFLLFNNIYAEENSMMIKIPIDNISGIESNSVEELFDQKSKDLNLEYNDLYNKIKNSPKLSNLAIKSTEENLEFSANIMRYGKIDTINLKGKIYAITENKFANKLILADMDDTDEYKFVQFKVEKRYEEGLNKEANIIDITLQDIRTEQIIQFSFIIEDIAFNHLLKNTITEFGEDREFDEKVLELYSINRNLLNSKEETLYIEINSLGVNSENEIIDNKLEKDLLNNDKEKLIREDELEVKTYVTTDDSSKIMKTENQIHASTSTRFRDWELFFNDLERRGEVRLNNYNVDKGVFRNNGWNILNGNDFKISSYTKRNGSYEQLIHIGFKDMITHDSNNYANLQVEVINGMILSYDIDTDMVYVMHRNWAPKDSDVELAVGKLKNQSVFIRRNVSGIMGRPPRYMDAMSAILPTKASTAYNIWDALNTEERQDFGGPFLYEGSYEKQRNKYIDKVVRVISVNSGSAYLDRKGDRFLIEGDISGYTYDWQWGYKAQIRHSI